MRTEFLVVGRATMPDEEEQYRAYVKVVKAFDDHPIVIRTFDMGATSFLLAGIRRKRIRSWAGAPYACASTNQSCSRRSCGRCFGQRCMGTCESCCPW